MNARTAITRAAINGARLLQRLDDFAAIGATPRGGVDRQALTEGDRSARAKLAGIAAERGFAVYQDEAANLFVRRPGSDDSAPPFLIGSHLDTQPTGGRFDGALGTLAAFEVLESLEDAGVTTQAPVEVVAWTNEEGCRFAPGSLGAQAFVNGTIAGALLQSRSVDGARLADELAATLSALPSAAMRPLGSPIAGYIELHIEQGPILENEDVPIGVVTGVQGTRWLQVRVTGEAGHAGTTAHAARRDPMQAAVLGLARLYAAVMPQDEDARMTVGRISAEPGSINAIPASVVFSLDIRHPSLDRLDEIGAQIADTLQQTAVAHGCTVSIDRVFDMEPTRFAAPLIDCIEQVAGEQGLRHRKMISRAFHDALFIAGIAPSAMIFVPCRDGISHNEKEFVEPEHAVLGAEILLHSTLRALHATGLRQARTQTQANA